MINRYAKVEKKEVIFDIKSAFYFSGETNKYFVSKKYFKVLNALV